MKLFADSGCDLPLHFFESHQVTLIPLHVHLYGKDYEDIKGIDPKEVYKAIRQGEMPKTSQISPLLLEKLFTELAESGEPGIYPAFSSALSGTYQTAVMVRDQVKEKYADLDLTIIDTKAASLGYGLIVMRAAENLQKGWSKESIIADIEFYCQHMEHIFTVEDLNHLAKGGRLSSGAAWIGGLLNIKPILHVSEGKLIPIEKIRGRKKAFNRMLDMMEQRGEQLNKQRIAISHGDDPEAAELLKKMIDERFHSQEIFTHIIGSAIASHAGPGTIALFFLNKVPSS
ncbi:DegV family protein [Pseudobacillus wudalianchiensis]|uniref:Fatty acid-binding protein DegV n=1 Tax=Pseudobacillus wudalianchiensis TaxID=1743143 RepID=A0A1B9AUI0_9BACI|nr:DegV family protein [Bacillus wudalianchiensis]OCA87493.1 fatty acid-binding protein DegV [Bacillus wudalianchiensis]